MTGQLSLSLIEIIVLMLGAISVGITIHFFIVSRRSLNASIDEIPGGKLSKEISEWKLKYFNDIEQRDNELIYLQKRVAEAEENNTINSIEADEMRIQNKKLLLEIEALQKRIPAGEKPDYIEQLRLAQSSLLEHNEKISELLDQVDFVKEAEKKQQAMLKTNAELSGRVDNLKSMLAQKEKEISIIRQKEELTTEMTTLLENAHQEFNALQEKIRKLEGQVITSKTTNLQYEEIKEGYFKVSRDFEEHKLKFNVLVSENRQLKANLSETEEKLIEANFQRQQLQKKVAFLEGLSSDMQAVADAKKKLEGQLKRIGELENMLHIVSEEKNELSRQKQIFQSHSGTSSPAQDQTG
jgi:chromosome segregation ATPase